MIVQKLLLSDSRHSDTRDCARVCVGSRRRRRVLALIKPFFIEVTPGVSTL